MGNLHVMEPSEDLQNKIQEAYDRVNDGLSDRVYVQIKVAWAKFDLISRSQTNHVRIQVGHPTVDKTIKDKENGEANMHNFGLQWALNTIKYSLNPNSSGPHFESNNGGLRNKGLKG